MVYLVELTQPMEHIKMFAVQILTDGQWSTCYTFDNIAKAMRKAIRARQLGFRARVF